MVSKDVKGALEAAKGQFGPIEVVVNAVTDRDGWHMKDDNP